MQVQKNERKLGTAGDGIWAGPTRKLLRAKWRLGSARYRAFPVPIAIPAANGKDNMARKQPK
jgi:hypothetical protein